MFNAYHRLLPVFVLARLLLPSFEETFLPHLHFHWCWQLSAVVALIALYKMKYQDSFTNQCTEKKSLQRCQEIILYILIEIHYLAFFELPLFSQHLWVHLILMLLLLPLF